MHGLTRRSALLLPLALGACSWFDFLTDEAKPPIHGNREPILSPSRGLQVDAVTDIQLPPVLANPSWPQQGGDPSHVGGNLAGGLTRAWSRDIGRGGTYRTRITSQPVVAGGRVFTYDSDAVVAAWDLGTGARIWQTKTRAEKNRSGNLGGGISVDGDTVYAATGRAELLALKAADGSITWRKPLPAPARSAPTVVDGILYLCTNDQRIMAYSATNGAKLWDYIASRAEAGVLAVASPAYGDGLVVAGFESGDLVAVRGESGSVVWSDNLGTLKGTASLLEFATVRGAPVVENGIVYAIGLGGLCAALDLRSGRRVWERDIGGGNTPWLAGETLFIITSEQRVAALSKLDGTVHWVTDLPRFDNPKRTKGLITWSGPVLIAGKLLAVSTSEQLAIMDPVDGKIVTSRDIDAKASQAPVAAQGTMLLLTDDATLTAYK